MERKLYHATPISNMLSILHEGIRTGCDGVVYLAETKDDAMRFVVLHTSEPIIVFEVSVSTEDEKNIEESFDHSLTFFQCRAFLSTVPISPDRITAAWQYDIWEHDGGNRDES